MSHIAVSEGLSWCPNLRTIIDPVLDFPALHFFPSSALSFVLARVLFVWWCGSVKTSGGCLHYCGSESGLIHL